MRVEDLRPFIEEQGVNFDDVVSVHFGVAWWEIELLARDENGRPFGGQGGVATHRVCYTYDRDEAEGATGREGEGRVPDHEGVGSPEA
jgi:hypothetical protein